MPKGVYQHNHVKPKQYPPEMVAEVRRLYEQGNTQSEIAAALSTTQKVLWKLMRNHGIKARVSAKRDQRGPNNPYWRGGQAQYDACHVRVQVARGKPQHCQRCGTTDPAKHYDWASLTKNYHDINDYERMCRSCHWKFDNAVARLHSAGYGRKAVQHAS